MATSYGASLPDSEPLIHARLTSHLSLFTSLTAFLSSLTQTQRDASQKLSSTVGQFRRHLSSTASERSGGNEQGSSLELALASVFEEVDLQVREWGVLAEGVGREVVSEGEKVGSRLEGVRKKHHAHYKSLLAARDAANTTSSRSRSAYFSACESLESARQKRASASEKGGRDAEKAGRAYDAAYEDMEIAKDQYLLDLDAANVAKNRLYDAHLPAVEDEYQLLESSSVRQLVGLVERMVQFQRESGERVLASVGKAAEALSRVDVEADQEAWVARHEATILGAFEKPQDEAFAESPVWHDTDAFALSPSCVTYLQNVKHKAQTKASEMAPEIEAKRREVTGLRNLRESYERQRGLGDTVGVVENLFTTSHALSTLDFSSALSRAEVELIDATLGDDASTGLRPHEFKHSSFVTPSTCAVCEGSVWGKGLQCKTCSMAVHAKCELKVPAGCAARPGAGIVRAKSKKMGPTSSQGSVGSGVGSPVASSGSSFTSLSTTTLPPPRRTVPPPASGRDSSLPPMPSAQNPSSAPLAGIEQRAVMLYDYEAQSGFELSVQENDPLLVLVPEDDSGWVKVRVDRAGDAREGLVPASYIEVLRGGGAAEGAAAVGGGGGGQRVIALYDYTSQAADELPLREGEEAELTATGMGAGEGWAEILKDGRTGIVPSSYIQAI
ncbi:hypothetical protein JCM6882_002183 [Rhodosporidiobolus microsporus]